MEEETGGPVEEAARYIRARRVEEEPILQVSGVEEVTLTLQVVGGEEVEVVGFRETRKAAEDGVEEESKALENVGEEEGKDETEKVEVEEEGRVVEVVDDLVDDVEG